MQSDSLVFWQYGFVAASIHLMMINKKHTTSAFFLALACYNQPSSFSFISLIAMSFYDKTRFRKSLLFMYLIQFGFFLLLLLAISSWLAGHHQVSDPMLAVLTDSGFPTATLICIGLKTHFYRQISPTISPFL